MPMAPYIHLDFGSRITAIRATGVALTVANNLLPDQSAANSDRHCLKWINNIRVAKALSPLPSLDYGGVTSALNVLTALVP